MISYDSPQLVPYLYFSACDAAGYDGQWVGGICPYWGTDICTCDTDVIDVFKEILTDLNITPAQWFTLDEYDREDLFPEE